MARSDDLLLACPECDSSSVKRNVVTDLQGPKVDVSKYACEDCGNRFGEYGAVYRERKMESRPRKDSVARTLLDAHPDDLATDGGSIQPDENETGARSEDATDRTDGVEELPGKWRSSYEHGANKTEWDKGYNAAMRVASEELEEKLGLGVERTRMAPDNAAAMNRHDGAGLKIRLYGVEGPQLVELDRETARSLARQIQSVLGDERSVGKEGDR